MGIVGRSRIDFKQMNAKRISILVANPENAGRLVDYFSRHQYEIQVSSDASALYAELCEKGAPGFVFVSTQIDGPMAKMMPDFVVKRFRVPVILFNESKDLPLPPTLSPQSLPPEIIPANEMEPDQLLHTLENFDEVYKARLAERASGARPADPVLESESETAPEFDLELALSSKSEQVFRLVKEAFVPGDVPIVEEDVLTLHACKVADPTGRGYFVFAFPVRSGEHQPDQALVILESRVREAAGEGAVIENLMEAVPARFFRELKERSDEVVEGRLGDMEMVLLYFRNRDDVAEPVTRLADDKCLIPIEEWWCRLPLPCHTYVWLERNNKRILYVRPGDCLRPESFERFRRKGLQHLMVEATDFPHYRRIREMVHIADNLGAVSAATSPVADSARAA